ncbi:hypothetical protein C7448_103251 [Tenacibaculum gallaicum]|uniref:DUF2938 family protein n=1 Tax=Tenacibaculum gallaicum TaxID=561505 RepID=A0A3E0I1W9_9FLAO|nr:DUF2938 domain-containing protein [Tenacibaculum gallaicum]REH52516.1 hypothetical protein C7448_103251 [Tenacibaculum gallaicum]
MSSLFQTILVGIGATITMDVYSFILNAFGIKTLNYKFLGRWIGHFFNGKFSHHTIFTAPSIKHEHIIGWVAHYAIGITFALFLVLFFGKKWLENPTFSPALIIGIITVIAPFFFMQPAFGLGIAASNTPHPIKAQIMSLITHAVFGFGLFLSAKILSILVK